MRRPDFFVIGAPKCGTTALAQYLGEHPQVFMCEPKEPNYFARHLTVERVRRKADPSHVSLEGYLRLFEAAGDEHAAVGEASTRYLRSPEALRELHDFAPEARIVVMLRHPVDLAYSWHSQKLYEGQEDEPDFERAWALQGERKRGRRLPPGLVASDALFYEDVARLGSQLEQVQALFDAGQVHVAFFDDFRREPRGVYEGILAFLGVASDGRSEFPVVNPARRIRRPGLARLLRPRASWLHRGVAALKRGLGVRDLGVSRAVDRLVAEDWKRSTLAPTFRKELLECFGTEIDKLERLTGRDLAAWRSPEPA